jgi:hypothetical protein
MKVPGAGEYEWGGYMEGSRKQPHSFDSDSSDPFALSDVDVTVRRKSDAEAAIQYLTWALEAIGKAGSRKAADHVRGALAALDKDVPPKTAKD